MLRYFYLVIENLLSTGILAALLWAAPVKDGNRKAFWACIAGTAAALVLAVLRRTTGFINRGFVNTWTLSCAVLLGIAYILLLWHLSRGRASSALADRRLRLPQTDGSGPRGRVQRLTAVYAYVRALLLAALLFYALPTIFLYPAEFALPGESIVSTDFLFKLIGFAAGLAVVAVTALALYKAGRNIPALPLGILLTAALVVNMGNQAVVVIQFLMARRIILPAGVLFRLIIAGVNHSILFVYALMALGLAAAVTLFASGLRAPVTGRNPAERRKHRAAQRTERRLSLTVTAGFVVSVLALTAVKAYTRQEVVLSPAEPMTITGGEITIPVTQIEDGRLHRFAYTASDGTEVRFIVIKKNEVAYGVGLDACDICGATGYYERKDEVICRLCDVVMNISTIGFKGGCNPVPLAYTLRSGAMVIETARLEDEKNRFK